MGGIAELARNLSKLDELLESGRIGREVLRHSSDDKVTTASRAW